MSSSTIKIIACLFMLVDHIGFLISSSDLNAGLPEISYYMRVLGRLSFPLFAYLIVNGLVNTRSKTKYFSNMILFASISQVPYILFFDLENSDANIKFLIMNNILNLSILILMGYILFLSFSYFDLKEKRKRPIMFIFLIALLIIFFLKMKNIWVINEDFNVLYSFAFSIFLVFYIEKVFLNKIFKILEAIILTLIVLLFFFIIGIDSSYGVFGILLTFSLYLSRKSKLLQAFVVCFWGGLYYTLISVTDLKFVILVCISSIFILSYNGKKGLKLKYIFYSFYPVHLFTLGLLKFFL